MRTKHYFRGVASVEMVFGMVMVVLMVFSVLKVGLWSGLEMAEVQINHDDTFTNPATQVGAGTLAGGPMGQIDPVPFHKPLKINAIWKF